MKTKKVKIPAKYFTAVKEGTAFLDFMFGRKTWLKRIDMSLFNIEDVNTCVAGNVFKDGMFSGDHSGYENFLSAVNQLGGKGSDTAVRFGFYSNTDKGYQHLQDIWVHRITHMKKAARLK